MNRRQFVGVAAGAAVMPALGPLAMHAAPPDLSGVKLRKTAKPEIVYKSPHAKPNGLQAAAQGLWVQDQGAENWVSLVNYADGKVIREFKPDIRAASGVTVDPDNVMWLASTYNCMIVSCSSEDGKTLAKYWTPGAGRIYPMAGDPPAARSPLQPAFPPPERATNNPDGGGNLRRFGQGAGPGQLPLDAKEGLTGTGAHGLEYRAGLLYVAVPPARHVFVMEPKSWVVQAAWRTAGNRPHGIGWEGDTLWVSDSNLRAFFRHEIKTGKIVERIQLTESDPLIHGATVHDGRMWYCDDMGYICNFKL